MVWPASVAVATAVRWVVELKVGVAGSGTALAMGLGVCSHPQGYSERESLRMNGERERERGLLPVPCLTGSQSKLFKILKTETIKTLIPVLLNKT